MSFFWVGHFEFFFSKKKNFFCFILMKISPNLYGRMDGSKFWCFPWFPENSSLCIILCYTVYMIYILIYFFANLFNTFWWVSLKFCNSCWVNVWLITSCRSCWDIGGLWWFPSCCSFMHCNLSGDMSKPMNWRQGFNSLTMSSLSFS